VAAHLLDTQNRKLAAARHGYKPENSKKLSPAKLVALINSSTRKASAVQPVAARRIDLENGNSVAGKRGIPPGTRSFRHGHVSVSWAGKRNLRTGLTRRASSPSAGTINSRFALP